MIYLKTSRSLAQRKTNETKSLGSTQGGRWGTGNGLVGARGGEWVAAASAGAVRDAAELGRIKGFLPQAFKVRFAVKHPDSPMTNAMNEPIQDQPPREISLGPILPD